MTIIRAHAKLVEDLRIDVDNRRKHAICLDQPISDLGTDMGPTALELCLMSDAGCYASIFMLTAKKMRIPIEDLEVNVEGVKTEEAGTLTEEKYDITIKTKAPEDRIQRIHTLTAKNCPVGRLVDKAGTKKAFKVTIEKP
jgi:putative redox protein